MKYRISARAGRDLEAISRYIAEDSPLHAAEFVRGVILEFEKICSFPYAAPSRPSLGKGVRMMVHGKYSIFYRPMADYIRIERVLHTARDVRTL